MSVQREKIRCRSCELMQWNDRNNCRRCGETLPQPVVHVRKTEVIFWIEHNWLQATVSERGKRKYYTITPEALKDLYKHHHRDLMQRGMRNLALFEAYVEYCFAPKHTVGEQLLNVRRDKKERAAFAAVGGETSHGEEDDDEEDAEMEARYRVELADPGPGTEPGEYDT